VQQGGNFDKFAVGFFYRTYFYRYFCYPPDMVGAMTIAKVGLVFIQQGVDLLDELRV
jgi:hypothetical protein